MQDIGYESHNSILILGTNSIVLGSYFFTLLVFIILIPMKYFCKGKCCTKKLYNKIYPGLFFNNILTILFEAYLEFLIAGYMNLKQPLNTYVGEILGSVVAWVGLILCLVVLPVFSIIFIRINKDKFEKEGFNDKWDPFYKGETKYKTKLERAFKLVFIIRRIVFLSIAFSKIVQIYQIILMQALQLVFIIYYAGTRPLINRRIMNLSIINEFLV